MITRVARIAVVFGLAFVGCLTASQDAMAEYVIGSEDVLEISFWQDPALNRQVTVGLDGSISLDVIGQVEAAGNTTTELENELARLMYRLRENVSQASVSIVEYRYNHIYIIGQANVPGKKAFEEIPDLWTIINESGGVTPLGDLSRVTIIRGGDDAGQIEIVNVHEALASGQLDNLPKVRRQDTIEIPRMPGQVLSGEVARSTDRKNLIYVIGAVNLPGAISFEDNIDVAEALAYAGGPSEAADLCKAQLILKDGYYAQTVMFDLEEYSRTGKPARYIMGKEDMLLVPVRRQGFLASNVGILAAALGAITTAILIYDRLSPSDGGRATGGGVAY